MDSETIYAVGGVIVFLVVAMFILRSNPSVVINTKDEKRDEILGKYKKELRESLASLGDDKEARVAKKSELLKRFSSELSSNIFFDQIEIREIILDLAEDY